MARARETSKSRKGARLREMTLNELHEVARANEIEGFSELNKDELVELLMGRRLTAESWMSNGEAGAPTPEEHLDAQEELERLRDELHREFH